MGNFMKRCKKELKKGTFKNCFKSSRTFINSFYEPEKSDKDKYNIYDDLKIQELTYDYLHKMQTRTT
jgi:hypothetical protein